jgi:16S rRNA G966 N2-methylase RsmD
MLEARLAQICEQAFESLNFPLASITNVRVREIWSERFEVEGKSRSYILTVVTPNPPMLRGDILPYKGSYKERVEALVQDHLNRTDPGATAHIEIVGPTDRSIDGFISIQELVKSGKVSANSPIVRTATKYRVPGALLHGRHLIGPSPALASLVRRIVVSDRVSTILDLFAGTGVVAKVACAESVPTLVTVVERDQAKINFMQSHLPNVFVRIYQEDSLFYPINGQWDLIVADPYYEHVMCLLDARGECIRKNSKRFLLACGSIEDIGWTQEVRVRLCRFGFNVRRHAKFGQVIFECTAP